MSQLTLSVAIGDYDRNRPLIDGTVRIDGVQPLFMTLSPEEIFFRAMRTADFDICELSLSSFTVRTARGDNPYVGVPAFVSRAFRHTSIYVRTDRVREPKDLVGRKVGVPEYQLTANVWARAILQDDFGVKPSDLLWVRAGMEQAHRPEKIPIQLPENVRLSDGPAGKTISQLLEEGSIDAFIAPRPPKLLDSGNPHIGCAVPRSVAAAQDYYHRTGIFPIVQSDRRTQDARRTASVAACRGAQGIRALEDTRAGGFERYVGDESHAAVRGRATSRCAHSPGTRLLAVRGGSQSARRSRLSCGITTEQGLSNAP